MIISNETGKREAQFSRNCITENSCFKNFRIYMIIYMIKFHYDNTENNK